MDETEHRNHGGAVQTPDEKKAGDKWFTAIDLELPGNGDGRQQQRPDRNGREKRAAATKARQRDCPVDCGAVGGPFFNLAKVGDQQGS